MPGGGEEAVWCAVATEINLPVLKVSTPVFLGTTVNAKGIKKKKKAQKHSLFSDLNPKSKADISPTLAVHH